MRRSTLVRISLSAVVALLVLAGCVFWLATRGVCVLTVENTSDQPLRDLVIVWPERRAEYAGSLAPGHRLTVRHPVQAEGGVFLYYAYGVSDNRPDSVNNVRRTALSGYMTPLLNDEIQIRLE